MLQLIGMHIQHYIRKGLPFWIILFLLLIVFFADILGSLSIADHAYVKAGFLIAGFELVAIIFAIYGALYGYRRLKNNYNHVLHAYGFGYHKLYSLWWCIGLLPIIYLGCIFLCFFLFIDVFQVLSINQVIFLCVTIVLKSLLLYTIIYTLLPRMQYIFAIIFGLVLYWAAYSIPVIKMLIQQIDSVVLYRLLSGLVYILPYFVNYSIDIVSIAGLQQHFFTIAITQGIYIIGLLLLGSIVYAYSSRK